MSKSLQISYISLKSDLKAFGTDRTGIGTDKV